MRPLQKALSPAKNSFARTKAAFATIDEEYRSSEDEDYESGDEIPRFQDRSRSRKRAKQVSTSDSTDTRRASSTRKKIEIAERVQPMWVRAISMPEEYDGETGMFTPVDKYYRETRDNDYYAPFGLEYTEKDTVNGVVKYHFEEWSEGEDEDSSEEDNLEKENIEKENLDEELKALLEDAKNDLPQDLVEGKHRINSESVKDMDKKSSEDVADIEEGAEIKEESEKESSDSDAKSSSDSDSKNSEAGKLKERKIWYEYFYLKFVENLQVDDEYEDTTEYYPAAMITDPDLDYDEADPEEDWEIPADEVKGLQEDLKVDVSKLGNYIPIWVHVESVKSRKDVAKELFEEEQKAIAEAAAAKKAAEEEAAAKKAAAEEAAVKAAAEKESAVEKAKSEPLNLQNIESAAKEVTDETKSEIDAAKPQRKLSAKGSPKNKSPKKEGESPKEKSPK